MIFHIIIVVSSRIKLYFGRLFACSEIKITHVSYVVYEKCWKALLELLHFALSFQQFASYLLHLKMSPIPIDKNILLHETATASSDVYEESEADLLSERNNNDFYRSTKSRSPDYSYNERKGSKGDRRYSSGFQFNFFTFLYYLDSSYFLISIFLSCQLSELSSQYSSFMHVIIYLSHSFQSCLYKMCFFFAFFCFLFVLSCVVVPGLDVHVYVGWYL